MFRVTAGSFLPDSRCCGGGVGVRRAPNERPVHRLLRRFLPWRRARRSTDVPALRPDARGRHGGTHAGAWVGAFYRRRRCTAEWDDDRWSGAARAVPRVRRRNVYAPRSPPQRERLRKRFGPRPLGPVCVSAVPTWRPPKTASICTRLGRGGGGKRPADKLHRPTERRCERTRARRCFFSYPTHTHTHMAVPMFTALRAINFVLCLLSSSSHGKRFRRTRTVSVPVSFVLRHRRTKRVYGTDFFGHLY